MKERLIVDMDGVLADTYQQYIITELKESGVEIKYDETLGLLEEEAFPNCIKHLETRGFFRTIPVMKNAQDTLRRLNEKFEVFVVSAATEFPFSLEEKYFWLEENFPFLTWEQFVFCGDNKVVKGDIMIDDFIQNLDSFQGRTILFSQPHNCNLNEHLHERVENWKDLENLLLS